MVVDDSLSIENGVLKGWDKPQSYYYQLLVGLSIHKGFNLQTPWSQLDDQTKDCILNGCGREIIPYGKMGLYGRFKIQDRRFEGVLPCLQRRYQETDSDAVRSELSSFVTTGIALNIRPFKCSARNVRIHGTCLWIDRRIIDKIYSMMDSWELLHLYCMIPFAYTSQKRGTTTLALLAQRTSLGGEGSVSPCKSDRVGLTGVMYVLDEPSIGLHQRDNEKLIQTLYRLRDLGNSVIVEHDEETMLHADYIIDIGPGAGIHGGEVVAHVPAHSDPKSLTGQYLSAF